MINCSRKRIRCISRRETRFARHSRAVLESILTCAELGRSRFSKYPLQSLAAARVCKGLPPLSSQLHTLSFLQDILFLCRFKLPSFELYDDGFVFPFGRDFKRVELTGGNLKTYQVGTSRKNELLCLVTLVVIVSLYAGTFKANYSLTCGRMPMVWNEGFREQHVDICLPLSRLGIVKFPSQSATLGIVKECFASVLICTIVHTSLVLLSLLHRLSIRWLCSFPSFRKS